MRLLLIPLLGAVVGGCGSAAPERLPPTVSPLTVCEAAAQPVGRRVRVIGEFAGVAPADDANTFLLRSSEPCGATGPITLWAELSDEDDRERLADLRPPNAAQQEPGALLTIEGAIAEGAGEQQVRLTQVILSD
jgi:hypothetical protein